MGFNPNFPQAFSFPAFAIVEWLALAWWDFYKGDAAKVPSADKIRAGAKLDWQKIWFRIAKDHLPGTPGVPNTTDFSMKHPEGWVQTLLDTDRFWLVEINSWALQMVVEEYEEKNPDAMPAINYTFPTWAEDGATRCEHFCRRFHAYGWIGGAFVEPMFLLPEFV